MSIIEFLETRIAEDEERAEYVLRYGDWGGLFKPPRVLAECAAKRATIEACREDHEDAMASNNDVTEVASEVLYSLAAIYKDHPDYQQEWAL